MDTQLSTPIMGYRFYVCFLKQPNPINLQFQKVSGLSLSLTIEEEKNSSVLDDYEYTITGLNRGIVSFERGLFQLIPPLIDGFNCDIEEYKFKTFPILICVLNNECEPIKNWVLYDSIITDWSLGNLDAASSSIIIETMKVKYRKIEPIGL